MRRMVGRIAEWFASRVMLGLANLLSIGAFRIIVWSWSFQKTPVSLLSTPALPPIRGEVLYEAPEEEDTDPDIKGLN